MSAAAAFLKAIVDDPDADGPRLVYADWLEEHGDAARAEFIRLQIELARSPRDHPDRPRRELRQHELLVEHQARWLDGLATWARRWEFHRGFVEVVEAEADDFVTHAGAAAGRVPLRHLKLKGLGPRQAERVAAMPTLAPVRELVAGPNLLCDEGLSFLVRSPYLGRLETLQLHDTNLGPDAGGVLAGAACLAGVRHLDLAGNRLGDDGVAALTESAHLGRLRTLNLGHNRLEGPAARSMAVAPTLPRLEVLNLRDNRLRPEALIDLAHAPGLAALTTLDLTSNALDVAGAAALASADRLPPRLTTFILAGNRFAAEGVRHLAGWPLLRQLSVLDLSNNDLLDAGAAALAASPFLTNVTVLDLRYNRLGDDAAVVLADAPALENVQRLLLQGNRHIRHRGQRALYRRFGKRYLL